MMLLHGALNDHADWAIYLALACTFACAIYQRYLPRNLFVDLLLNGFFGASLAMIWVQFGATGILLGLSDLSWAYQKQYFLPFVLMLSFPEGFITGAFLTMLVLFQPQWVYTFRDEIYQLKS